MREHQAVVLGMSITGLAVCRCLGRRGVRVIGVDYDRKGEAFWSRFTEKRILPAGTKAEGIISFLLEIAEELEQKVVLYVDRDEYAFLISKHRAALQEMYEICLPDPGVLEILNNKAKLIEKAEKFGVSTPETLVFEGGDLTQAVKAWNRFPAILKPLYGYQVFTGAGFKTLVVGDRWELEQKVKNECRSGFSFLLQEMIPGDDDAVFSTYVYCDRHRKALGVCSSRKILQSPKGNGIGVLIKSGNVPALESLTVSFLRDCKYSGLAEAEFKRDYRDGRFKLIEINTRPWLQFEMAQCAGSNVGMVSYHDLNGSKIRVRDGKNPSMEKFWVFELPYLMHYIKNGYLREVSAKDLVKIIKLLINRRIIFAVFSLSDPGPFIRYFLFYLFGGLKKALKSRVGEGKYNRPE